MPDPTPCLVTVLGCAAHPPRVGMRAYPNLLPFGLCGLGLDCGAKLGAGVTQVWLLRAHYHGGNGHVVTAIPTEEPHP